MPSPYSLLLAGFFIVLGEFLFASMGVSIRFVATQLPNEVIVFFRNLFGLLLLAPWLARHNPRELSTGVPARMPAKILGLHLLRAVAGLSAMYAFYYAIAHIALAEAMLLKLTAPLFIPLIAFLWLREELTPLIWIALGLGFCGVLMILSPGVRGVSTVALVGLLGGMFAALAKVTIRRLCRSEPSLGIVFYFALIATIISAVPLSWSWQMPSSTQFPWLLSIAALATLGQLALTAGLSRAPASRMAPFGYFSVVFGALFGWLIWAEPVGWRLVLGSILIAGAGWLVSRRRASQPARSIELAPPATSTAAMRTSLDPD
ncbi:carboxylate/amino acid/amine transporter [Thiorhodovibrio winogradskyi]|uniref:Carboxylate/amino acid/amine transporter n=1 Tax=Thiorhodovibrio winogradskyi TaxID=77007 RepID=A0ABZ0SFI6_9GAMM|nr:DMT family transporter [Thiorhodovibrio winogradskyi]